MKLGISTLHNETIRPDKPQNINKNDSKHITNWGFWNFLYLIEQIPVESVGIFIVIPVLLKAITLDSSLDWCICFWAILWIHYGTSCLVIYSFHRMERQQTFCGW